MAALRNASTGVTLSHDVERAATPWRRALGLLLRFPIEKRRGLWFERCRTIHTIGMRSALDVIFLDGAGCIVNVKADVRPNQLCVRSPGTHAILEMGPGFLEAYHLALGDRLELVASP